MSVKHAAAFIARIRSEPALQARLRALGDDPDLPAIVALAAETGVVVSEDDLRTAYRYDWTLRRLAAAPSAARN